MLDKSITEQVLSLSKEKKSLREIAGQLGIGKTTVATIIKKHSVPAAAPVEPQIIISEPSIEMEKGATDDFMKALMAETSTTEYPPLDKSSSDAFLSGFMADLNISDPKTKRRGGPNPPKTPKVRAPPPGSSYREPTPVTQPKPPAAVMEKGELIAKITLNVNTFPEVLKDYIKPNKDAFIDGLQKKTQHELSAIMSTMDYSRSISNTAGVMKSLTLTGAALLEMGTKKLFNMRTDGFAQAIGATTELETLLKEIAMENQNGIISKYQSPTVRLTTLVVTTLMAVDAKNRSGIQIPNGGDPTPANNLEGKYNDL